MAIGRITNGGGWAAFLNIGSKNSFFVDGYWKRKHLGEENI